VPLIPAKAGIRFFVLVPRFRGDERRAGRFRPDAPGADMQLFLQQIVEGLASGAIYASLALALVLVYRATRVVNFAQGEMATFTAYLVWQLSEWGVPFWIAFAVVAVASFALGALVFRLAIRPVMNASDHTMVVICIGLFVGFEAICLWVWGSDAYAFPRIFSDKAWMLGGIRFTAANLGVLAVLCALALALTALFRFTRIGLAMRASAIERV
jgi:branched-chain amino acid transport system permease protein